MIKAPRGKLSGFLRAFHRFSPLRFLAILLVLGGVLLQTGCASRSPSNPHDDWVLVGEETEKSMGQSAARQLERQVGLYESDTLTEYVSNIGQRVATYSDRTDLQYRFKILDIFIVNALALPGGYIYVTRGLIQKVENESQLAAVLAHEVAHVAAFHSIKRTQLSVLSTLASIGLAAAEGGRGLQGGMLAGQMVTLGYTRSAEEQADNLGIAYAARAGYDPAGMRGFLRRLLELQGEIPSEELLYMRSHPYLSDRIQRSRILEDQYHQYLGDTPITDPPRFHRNRRRFLFTDREQEFLTRFDRMVQSYEQQDLEAMKEMTTPDFEVGSDTDSERSARTFFEQIRSQFEKARRIQYDYRLVKLDVGDTNANVIYQFETKLWTYQSEAPELSRGMQQMIWRRQDDRWKLTRLR